MRAYYFGCYRDVGHFFWNEHLREVNRVETGQIYTALGKHIDGAYAPRDTRGNEEKEGEALVTHKNGWTVLAFWDRSIDKRPASNSAFIFDRILEPEAALGAAMATFPSIFDRFKFKVTLKGTE